MHASDRKEAQLFTYQARVERVVGADTLRVKVNVGFDHWTRQYLRLRGINAPEMEDEAGKKAKDFLSRLLVQSPHVLATSTRSDKYDRYLADVFIPLKGDERVYVNQRLIDEGHAVRVRE